VEGKFIIIQASAGTGKSTLKKELLAEQTVAQTYTTRSIRDGETNGIDRHFVDRDRFERLCRNGTILVEYTAFGERYGFAADIRRAVANGDTVIEQVVPFSGFQKVTNAFSDLPMRKILLLADLEDIALRLKERSPEDFKRRMEENRGYIKEHVLNINKYDEVKFAFPSKLFKDQIDSLKKAYRLHEAYAARIGDPNPPVLDPKPYIEFWLHERMDSVRANPLLYKELNLIGIQTIMNGFSDDKITYKYSSDMDRLRSEGFESIDKELLSNVFGFNAVRNGLHMDTQQWIDQTISSIENIPNKDSSLEPNPVLRPVLQQVDGILTRMLDYRGTLTAPPDELISRIAFKTLSTVTDLKLLARYRDFIETGVQPTHPIFPLVYDFFIEDFKAAVVRGCLAAEQRIVDDMARAEGKELENYPAYEDEIYQDMISQRDNALRTVRQVESLDSSDPLLDIGIHSNLINNSAPNYIDHLNIMLETYVWASAHPHGRQNQHIHNTIVPLISNYMRNVALPSEIEHPLQKYFLHCVSDFVSNLFALSIADRSKPNSMKNMTMYPVLTSKEQFIRAYLPRRIPSERQSMEKIAEILPLLYEATR